MPVAAAPCCRRATGFNPRPADWPGDARFRGGRAAATHRVSIRARPIGRAMRRWRSGTYPDLFQSAPGRLAGRCPAAFTRRALRVSIRARPIGRAMHTERGPQKQQRLFQSAPGRLAGRCPASAIDSSLSDWFQSAPGRLAGRCREDGLVPLVAADVSIRARPIGRAMLETGQLRRAAGVSIRARPIGRAMPRSSRHISVEPFQSAPGRLAGRCTAMTADRGCVVSIRARPIGRAMPAMRCQSVST